MNTTTNGERPKTTQSQTSEQPDTALRAAAIQVENVRNVFRESVNGLNQVLSLLKAAEKEQKNSEKEIESVRSTLRSLQRVQI